MSANAVVRSPGGATAGHPSRIQCSNTLLNVRTWMYERVTEYGLISPLYIEGVDEFLNAAFGPEGRRNGDKVVCPCSECRNDKWHTRDDVKRHLWRHGFVNGYKLWFHHGESWDALIYSCPLRSPRLFGIYSSILNQIAEVFADQLFKEPSFIADVTSTIAKYVPSAEINEGGGSEEHQLANDGSTSATSSSTPVDAYVLERFMEKLRADFCKSPVIRSYAKHLLAMFDPRREGNESHG